MFNLFKKNLKEKQSAEKNVEAVKNGKDNIEQEIEKEANIYVMPERFRVAQKEKGRAKNIGLFIMIGGGVFLVSASAIAYYYFFMAKPVETAPAPILTETPAVEKKDIPAEQAPEAAPVEAQKNSKESYLEMKAELDKVFDFAGFEAAILKYGSKNIIKEFEKEKNQNADAPDSFKENIISLTLRISMPKLNEIGKISESVKGNTAVLSASTIDLKQNGAIQMVREENLWKLESESWESAPEADETKDQPIVFQPGQDQDSDGLTDKEETIFGSNPNSSDSDSDGYGDLSETMNLYNPAGQGKLSDSQKIKKYLNNSYGYELIYPAAFSVAGIGGDDSIIFRSDDNHFIQAIAQVNQDGLLIGEWYEKQFSEPITDNSRRLAGDGWQGVRSEDGLIIYLTDNNQRFIFTLTYNLGSQNVLEYKNIFAMMVKSFKIAN